MKTEALMNKVLAEELKASVPELQEEMVIAVKARGDAWRKFNTIESEYNRITVRYNKAKKELDEAKANEATAVHFLTSTISVQYSRSQE